MWFRVQGSIICTPIRFCDCEFCEGHRDETETLYIDTILPADSYIKAEALAAEKALDTIPGEMDPDWEWSGGPYTSELPEDQFLRLLDAPSFLSSF